MSGRLLRNDSHYRRCYELYDDPDFEVTRIKGETWRSSRNAVEEIFLYPDSQMRKSLRPWIGEVGTVCRKYLFGFDSGQRPASLL